MITIGTSVIVTGTTIIEDETTIVIMGVTMIDTIETTIGSTTTGTMTSTGIDIDTATAPLDTWTMTEKRDEVVVKEVEREDAIGPETDLAIVVAQVAVVTKIGEETGIEIAKGTEIAARSKTKNGTGRETATGTVNEVAVVVAIDLGRRRVRRGKARLEKLMFPSSQNL